MLRELTVPTYCNPRQSKFSLANAIRDEVEREDLVRWALENESRPLVPSLETKKAPFRPLKAIIALLP